MNKRRETILRMSVAMKTAGEIADALGLTKRQVWTTKAELRADGYSIPRQARPKHSMRKCRAIVPHPTDPTLALVPLTRGQFAVISAVDAGEAGKANWQLHVKDDGRTMYAGTRKHGGGFESLHRMIGIRMGLSLHAEVDHRNGNGLDCRRSNLRDATQGQNCQNARRRRDNKTGAKGVTRYKGRYLASIRVGGKRVHLGYFDTVMEASDVAVEARKRLHGEFANHGVN